MALIVCPASQVEAAMRQGGPSHAISLISPDAAAVELGFSPDRHLTLRFNDIAAPTPGLVPPDAAMVARLLAFAAHCPNGARILLHCYAGVSRSPAAAYVIACQQAGPGSEAKLADHLRRMAPTATPNPWIVALADSQLRRAGAMTRAIARLGRGESTFEGETFEYP